MPWVPRSGFVRVECLEQCHVQDGLGGRDGVVWNVSLLGVYVVINPIPVIDETLRLTFRLPGDPTPVWADGRVAWRNPPSLGKGVPRKAPDLPAGCGVEFMALDAKDRRRIQSHLRLAGEPSSRRRAPSAEGRGRKAPVTVRRRRRPA